MNCAVIAVVFGAILVAILIGDFVQSYIGREASRPEDVGLTIVEIVRKIKRFSQKERETILWHVKELLKMEEEQDEGTDG